MGSRAYIRHIWTVTIGLQIAYAQGDTLTSRLRFAPPVPHPAAPLESTRAEPSNAWSQPNVSTCPSMLQTIWPPQL
eukprot:996460-Rhodomonas_salina.2